MSYKIFDRDSTSGQVFVTEVGVYGDIERPVGRFELVGEKVKGFFTDCIDTVRLVFTPEEPTE